MAIDLNQPEIIEASISDVVRFWQRGVNAVRTNMTYSVHSTDAGLMREDEFISVSESQMKLLYHILSEYSAIKDNRSKIPITSTSKENFLMSSFCHDVATRLTNQISNWIVVAKSQNKAKKWLSVAREMFNLNPTPSECIRMLVEFYMLRICDKRIDVHLGGLGNHWTFRDKNILETAKNIFANLLENAIKYGRENGTIQIERNGNKIIFKDDGIGMDPSFAGRLGKGRQIREGRAIEVEGSGIGWASIGNDMRKLGWEWEIDTRPDEGTTVTIHVKDGDIVATDIVATDGKIVHPVEKFEKLVEIPPSQIIEGMKVFDGAEPFRGYSLIYGSEREVTNLNIAQAPVFMAISSAQILLPLLSPAIMSI